MAYDVTMSTEYGGKAAPSWVSNGFDFPGYHNAFLSISKKSTKEEVLTLPFKISPSSFSEARSKLYQLVRTMGGWMIQKLGSNPIEINLSGYMLDIKGTLERHDFLDNYEKYIDDQKNYTSDYYNDYYTKLVIEGREYYGIVAGLNFQKSATNPFIYSYNLAFVALGQKRIYDASQAVVDARILMNKALGSSLSSNMYVSPSIGSLLNASSIQSGGANDKLSTPINTEEASIFNYTNSLNSQHLKQTETSNKAEISISESSLKTTGLSLFNNSSLLTDVASQPEYTYTYYINLVINRLPQETYNDTYGIKWNARQVLLIDNEYGNLVKNYKDIYPREHAYDCMIMDRNVYLNTVKNMSETLYKKIDQQVYSYLTSSYDNIGKNMYQYFKTTALSLLDSVAELANEEMNSPCTNVAFAEYRIDTIIDKIEMFFDYITKK